MKTAILAALALTAGLALTAPADAARGCGAGWHRGPHGGCQRNVVVRHMVVRPAVRVIYAPAGRPCPRGYHLGPKGRRCWPK